MAGVSVTFLGSGDAFNSGGRGHSSILVEWPAGRLVVDCGPTALHALSRRGIRPATLGVVLVTHFHGDHFLGLPMLCLHHQFASPPSSGLVVVGPAGTGERLMRVYSAVYESVAARLGGQDAHLISVRELPAGGEASVLDGGATVRAVAVNHSPEALGYRVGVAGRTLAFTGDTMWTESLVDLARDTDLLVCDGTFYDEEIQAHLRYHEVLARRGDLATRRLILSHLGARAIERAGSYEIETARDGLTIDL